MKTDHLDASPEPAAPSGADDVAEPWLDELLGDAARAHDAPADDGFTVRVMQRLRNEASAALPARAVLLQAAEARQQQERRWTRFSVIGAAAGTVVAAVLMPSAWRRGDGTAGVGDAAAQALGSSLPALQTLAGSTAALLLAACVLAWAVLSDPRG